MKNTKYILYTCYHNPKNYSIEITLKKTKCAEKMTDLFIISINPAVRHKAHDCVS